ncbi:MAG: ATP-binding protein [Desulfobulbus propionicus]|nr:MAG: ATP-binding protein [Desulfobulbus propionicus]
MNSQYVPKDLVAVCARVRQKSESYEEYNFSGRFNDFLKAFFDLAQEYDSLDDFYRICVAVPLELVGVTSALYLCTETDGDLRLVCSSDEGVVTEPVPAQYPVQLHHNAYAVDDAYIVPISSKQRYSRDALEKIKAATPVGDDGHGPYQGRIMGMYEVRPLADLSTTDKFFFVKYANRIGYNLENRLMALQNIDHLKFISTLVMDIEHNIIVPNIYFRHLFNQLKKKLQRLADFKVQLGQLVSDIPDRSEVLLETFEELESELFHCHQELVKHHTNTSLFIESLFRREHFERGHLVLHPRRCYVEKEVIQPQLEHYNRRFEAAGIAVERPMNMYDEEFQLMVDVGLLAQVYANLFSNAAKYTKEVVDHRGKPRKAVAYGREIINNLGPQRRPGIKFNVFSTGPHLVDTDRYSLFQEGIRGDDSKEIPGTGHGLSFIRHVVEMHGGEVGYEPVAEGNNFYFILPLPSPEHPPALVPDRQP